ncbi:hypothetical protein FGB62_238g07 [Gracilaria domingensis]|nr:hypothetical protein FGB62_238g07 [Gracilaria domingensis]
MYAIASEIQHPFGSDLNDLDLEKFAQIGLAMRAASAAQPCRTGNGRGKSTGVAELCLNALHDALAHLPPPRDLRVISVVAVPTTRHDHRGGLPNPLRLAIHSFRLVKQRIGKLALQQQQPVVRWKFESNSLSAAIVTVTLRVEAAVQICVQAHEDFTPVCVGLVLTASGLGWRFGLHYLEVVSNGNWRHVEHGLHQLHQPAHREERQ